MNTVTFFIGSFLFLLLLYLRCDVDYKTKMV
jgi:hypothetical protein